MFAFYTNNRGPAGVFRFYSGYISLVPNLVGYVSTFFSPTATPGIMAAYSLGVAAAARSLFYLRRFRFVVPHDRTRAWIVLLLASYPVGNFALDSSTTYSFWNLLWISLLLGIAPLPRGRLTRSLQFLIQSLIIWSHPLCVVLIPIHGFHLFQSRRNSGSRSFHAGIILMVISYLFFGISWGQGAQVEVASAIRHATGYLSSRVLSEGILGTRYSSLLQMNGFGGIVDAICIALAVLVCWWLIRNRQRLQRAQWYCLGCAVYLILALTLGSTLSRPLTPRPNEIWEQRYFYVQQNLVLTILSLPIITLLGNTRVKKTIRVGLSLCLVVWIFQLHHKSRTWFYSPPDQGEEVASFLRHVEMTVESGSIPEELVLDRSQWSIRIHGSSLASPP